MIRRRAMMGRRAMMRCIAMMGRKYTIGVKYMVGHRAMRGRIYVYVKMKNNIVKLIPICLCIGFILRPCTPALAEVTENDTYYEIGNGDNTQSYSDLLSKYKTSSVTYKRNILDYSIQALNGTLADQNHANVNSQHQDMLENIEKLNQTKGALLAYKETLKTQKSPAVTGSAIIIDTAFINRNQELINEIDTQIANIDLQLQQYSSSINSLEISLSDAQLSEDIADFYVDYQIFITEEAKKKLENDFLKRCYSLIIYQEQQDYNKAYQEYINMIKEVDFIRYRYGLITQKDLDADLSNILHNEIVITENQKSYETAMKAIKNDTGILDEIQMRLPLAYDKKEYNTESVIQEFINNNVGYMQIQNYIRSYQNHHDSARMFSYASYQQTDLQIDYYKLQKEELEDSIRAYANEVFNSYEKAFQSRDAAWKELQVKLSIYNSLKTKIKYKRASQLEVLKSYYEKEAAEAAYYQSCYEIVTWQDILDNHVYGAMP